MYVYIYIYIYIIITIMISIIITITYYQHSRGVAPGAGGRPGSSDMCIYKYNNITTI